MIVLRTEPGTPIRWQCGVCDDTGVISNWEDSPFDLRRRQPTVVEAANDIVIANEVAAALRDLQLLDTDCERLVFGPAPITTAQSCPPATTTWTN